MMARGAASPAGWHEVSIGEIADVVGGGTPSTKVSDNFDGNIPWLTPKDLSRSHDRYIGRGERNLSQKGLDSSSARLLPARSVLLSTRAPIGYVALAKNPIATNQGFRSLIVRDEALPEYLYYWLTLNTEELKRHASGTTFRELSGSGLKTIRLHLPPLSEQRAIADILGALDDKIELNKRMNTTLDEIARALFRSWFVGFEPVRAKAEGRPSGLPPALDALFPTSFEPSELEEIPAGWAVSSVYKCAEVIYGSPFSSKRFNEEERGLPLIRIRDLRTGAPQVFTDEDLPGARVVRPGRIVVGMDGEFRPHLWQGAPAYLNQRLCEFVEREPASRAFLLFGLEGLLREEELTKSATTVIHLLKRDIDRFRIVTPPAPLHAHFRSQTEPLLDFRVAMAEESRTLIALRDALLPQLVSGGVRLSTSDGGE